MEELLDEIEIDEADIASQDLKSQIQPVEEPPIIHQTLEEVLGEPDEDKSLQSPAPAVKIIASQNPLDYDLRKKEEILSNPSSIIENEILLRQ